MLSSHVSIHWHHNCDEKLFEYSRNCVISTFTIEASKRKCVLTKNVAIEITSRPSTSPPRSKLLMIVEHLHVTLKKYFLRCSYFGICWTFLYEFNRLLARTTCCRYVLTGCWERLHESIQWTLISTSEADEAWIHVATALTLGYFHKCFAFKIGIRTSRPLAVIHCLSTIDTCECTINGKSSNLLWFLLRRYLRNSNVNRHVPMGLFITHRWLTWVWNDLWHYCFCFVPHFSRILPKVTSLGSNNESNQETFWVMRWIRCGSNFDGFLFQYLKIICKTSAANSNANHRNWKSMMIKI